MARYIKKNATVEAEPFHRDAKIDGVVTTPEEWAVQAEAKEHPLPPTLHQILTDATGAAGLFVGAILTAEGWRIVWDGDYVLAGENGPLLMNAEAFEAEYEPAEPEEAPKRKKKGAGG